MTLSLDDFSESLTGLCNLAKASGLPDPEQSFALMLTALALADRAYPTGCSREKFVRMAAVVHDRLRNALKSGVEAG